MPTIRDAVNHIRIPPSSIWRWDVHTKTRRVEFDDLRDAWHVHTAFVPQSAIRLDSTDNHYIWHSWRVAIFVIDENTAGIEVTIYIVDSSTGLVNNDVDSLFPICGNYTTENPLRSSPDMSSRTRDTSKL